MWLCASRFMLISVRLSPQEFPDGAACAFLSSGNWAQDDLMRSYCLPHLFTAEGLSL